MALTIHGAGCCLIDYLYRDVRFDDDRFARLMSRTPGDGGLIVGGLVFAEHLAGFAGQPVDAVMASLAAGPPDEQNVGGPAIVSLVHTAQLCPETEVSYYGVVGDDETGRRLAELVAKTPVGIDSVRCLPGPTPATYVFSDPTSNDGHGERLFVNQLGVAAAPAAAELPDDFTVADIVQLGGTALDPPLHRRLPGLLAAARANGALTVVNTVYDFLAQSNAPDERWTLGSDESYPLIDLLVVDREEARRLTGCANESAALVWFLAQGVGAVAITCGPEPVRFAARAGRFELAPSASIPVFSGFSTHPLARGRHGDTTGCGDNFVGGMVAEIAAQLLASPRGDAPALDLKRAVIRGIASGAFCLTHLGGMYREIEPGEKTQRIGEVEQAYRRALEKVVDTTTWGY